ncbi:MULTISPECIES: hypothetical protein [unclassified Caballeronia]|uniref:hypothetical protein n=1 Tax=unclassified Caballeronia TaxID=2646786 RepID=UPI002866137C|nr:MULTISPECIES: hypothetical protein [unclassified Caballeronia]MDR5736374.1 hypothetical protein [Caballeronia sp. LZ016]MDR5811148.1 hypothetical protein [Caballeronia sp. LZ019]
MKFPSGIPAILLALAPLAMAPSTRAEETPNAQWRASETTLFDLIQNGYTMVSTTSVAARSTGLPEDTYLLQKTNSVYRCVETRATDSAATRSITPLRCAELVKPYRD